jgi:hypothetical protein
MRLLSCALFVCATAFAVVAADEFKPEPGFKLIFNGKNLDGWKTLGSKDKPGDSLDGKDEAFKGRFKVKDGELVIDPGVKGDVRIETAKEIPANATIRFEFKPDEKCNNDLFFLGQKFDLSSANVKNMKVGQWNPIEITAKGGKVEFKVNGEVIRSASTKAEKSTLGIRAEFGAIQIRHIRVSEGK